MNCCLQDGPRTYLSVLRVLHTFTLPATKPFSGLFFFLGFYRRTYTDLPKPLFVNISRQEKITSSMWRISSVEVANEAEQSKQIPPYVQENRRQLSKFFIIVLNEVWEDLISSAKQKFTILITLRIKVKSLLDYKALIFCSSPAHHPTPVTQGSLLFLSRSALPT